MDRTAVFSIPRRRNQHQAVKEAFNDSYSGPLTPVAALAFDSGLQNFADRLLLVPKRICTRHLRT